MAVDDAADPGSSTAGDSRRTHLRLVVPSCDDYGLQEGDLSMECRPDSSTKLTPLCGSNSGATHPGARGTQLPQSSVRRLRPAQSAGCRLPDDFARHENGRRTNLRQIAGPALRRRWTGLQTATDTASEQRFRIVHPFHPLRSRVPVCVGSRQRAGEERQFVISRPDGSLCLVPASWTDYLPPDPYLMIGKGRSHFRVEDLIALAEMLRGIES